MMLVGRPEDVVTTGITTAVVMVVTAISPHDAWHQPILRLFDTVVGMSVGLAGAWLGLRFAPRVEREFLHGQP